METYGKGKRKKGKKGDDTIKTFPSLTQLGKISTNWTCWSLVIDPLQFTKSVHATLYLALYTNGD